MTIAEPSVETVTAIAENLRAIAQAGAVPVPTPEQPLPLFNRELSWLEFNRRVLAEAEDPRVPLLERVSSSASRRITSTSSS